MFPRSLVARLLLANTGLFSFFLAFPCSSKAADDEMVSAEFAGTEAVLPKLKIEQGTHFERDWLEQHRKWLERVMVPPFADQVKGKPWADAAVTFFAAIERRLAARRADRLAS